ncbi:uncharacterized protein FIBRA_08115 [Fibroporia radiculosa]|uniref:Uncharacterized protein n=1 Tax=Fibroporia radiculosa TaxID=599839 RepID=J4GGJ0_9APHY|nr:uncharacterized protein FIBRA_08115 [Fibroporia radiculosa]CCM05878.1 predicted protein [Fibroporia radiculosa]
MSKATTLKLNTEGRNSALPASTTAAETLETLKGSLMALGNTFDALSDQATQMVLLGGELQAAGGISSIKNELQAQDRKHSESIEEVKALMKSVLENDVIEHLRQLIEDGLLEEIDEIVEEHVAKLLPHFVPQNLRDEIAEYKQKLEKMEWELHNSESRRLNAQLRTSRMHEAVHKIYKLDGTVSTLFPKDFGSLFSMDAETAKALVEEYELPGLSKSRDHNLNHFMQFCGIVYQLVRSPRSHS